jgi:hypothetical protein
MTVSPDLSVSKKGQELYKSRRPWFEKQTDIWDDKPSSDLRKQTDIWDDKPSSELIKQANLKFLGGKINITVF